MSLQSSLRTRNLFASPSAPENMWEVSFFARHSAKTFAPSRKGPHVSGEIPTQRGAHRPVFPDTNVRIAPGVHAFSVGVLDLMLPTRSGPEILQTL